MQPTTAPQGYSYIGNNDFRGYLAANAPQYLGYTGNDGKTDPTGLSNSLYSQGLSSGGDQFYSAANQANQAVADLYGKWQGYQTPANATQPLSVQPAANPNAQLLQSQLDQLDPQQSVGLQNIGNSYNLSSNRLDQQNAGAQRDYNTRTQQNLQNYGNARDSIMSNTAATANALQRLLGINGAGNSSAAYEQAPYAAGVQGSQNLRNAQQTYGNNASSLDTSWQDTQRSYSNAMQDLQNQRYQQENGLKSSIAQARANLLGQLGAPGSQDQINTLLQQITQLGQQYANPVIRTNDLSYAAPDPSQYTTGPQAPITQAGGANDLDPTFLGLLAGQRDRYGNLIRA